MDAPPELQSVYSLIKVENFVTMYARFSPCNKGYLLLRLQEIILQVCIEFFSYQ